MLAASACGELSGLEQAGSESLAKHESLRLLPGQRVPRVAEADVVGTPTERISRGSRAFSKLVECKDGAILFKDEEQSGADRMMTPRLRSALLRLAKLVPAAWPKLELRVTEAWDENSEHGTTSVHYEGRAADITTSDQDPQKLGRLGSLAVSAGFDWVFYEDSTHVHASVRK